MKRCPECRRDYTDETLNYCLDDGSALLDGPASMDEPATAILSGLGVPPSGGSSPDSATRAQIHTTEQTAVLPSGVANGAQGKSFDKRLLIVPLAIAVIVLGGFFGYRYITPAKQIESIAVMPFVNESGNADVEYLSDGMTETLITSLSQVPNLNVKGRSSVFRYKGRDVETKTLGKELGVQAVLYGRVIQRGDQLTLSLELLDALTENVIWSGKYDRKQADVVSLQSEIARDVSGKLKTKLSGADAAKVEKNYTDNAEAYQLYLKGKYFWNKRTGDALKQSVEFYTQAIERDPKFALAYAGLAQSYVFYPGYGAGSSKESMPLAKAAALRAIELDDSLADAHVALGIYYSSFSWNLPRAEEEFRRAIELAPNYATAHQQLGTECLVTLGRFDEAVAEGKRAAELDPVSPIIAADLGIILYRARRFDESIEQLNRVITLDPNFWVTYWYLGMAHHSKAQYVEAVADYRKALALDDNPWVKSLLIQSLVKAGQRSEAVKLLAELESESARRFVPSSGLAAAHGALGEKDKAFALLSKDVDERSSRAGLFAINPIWDDLRDDPRFADLINRVAASKLD